MTEAAIGSASQDFRVVGERVLAGFLVAGVAAVLLVVAAGPEFAVFLPAAMLVPFGALVVRRHPLANLTLILAGFALVADYQEGIQITEAVYGLYFLVYMAFWMISRVVVYRDPVVQSLESRTLMLFLIGITASIPLTIFFGGSMREVVSEWNALVMLAVFFPVREACSRHRHGVALVLTVMGAVVAFIAVRNLLDYQSILLGATQAWQYTKGRVATNDSMLMTAALASFTFLIFSRKVSHAALLVPIFLIAFASLILTQSRAFWMAFLVGAAVLFITVDRVQRRRVFWLTVAGLAAVIVGGIVLLGDVAGLVFAGIVDRLASLQTAATQDVSLVNRFKESGAAFEMIKKNPILGHGMGVPFSFYDIVLGITRTDAFIHNGFLSLWFKFGLWGVGLMIVFGATSIVRGLKAFRKSRERIVRLTALAASVAMIAYILPANTSNPFFLNDATFLIGVLTGVCSGCYERASRAATS